MLLKQGSLTIKLRLFVFFASVDVSLVVHISTSGCMSRCVVYDLTHFFVYLYQCERKFVYIFVCVNTNANACACVLQACRMWPKIESPDLLLWLNPFHEQQRQILRSLNSFPSRTRKV